MSYSKARFLSYFYLMLVNCMITSFLLSCTDKPVVIEPQRKAGFKLTTFFEHDIFGNAEASVAISSGDEISSDYTLKVNGKTANSIWMDKVWYFDNIPLPGTIYYNITHGNDVLDDSITIPGPVDSLFCNGVFLSPDSITTILHDSAFILKWHSATNDSLYRYILAARSTHNSLASGYSTTSEVTITPDYFRARNESTKLYEFSIAVTPYNKKLYSAGDSPDLTSESMYIYYVLNGLAYLAHFSTN